MSAKKRKGGAGRRGSKTSTRLPAGVKNTFLAMGPVPATVRESVPIMHRASEKSFSALTKQAVSYMNDACDTDKHRAGIAALAAKCAQDGLSDKQVQALFTGLVDILRAGSRKRTKAQNVEKDMAACNFPPHCVRTLSDAIRFNRITLEIAAVKGRAQFPTITRMRWRVDVTISTSSLSRVMKPALLMHLELSDGSMRTFECSIELFNQLRYKVARALRTMQNVESLAILKLTADLEKSKLPKGKAMSTLFAGKMKRKLLKKRASKSSALEAALAAKAAAK